MAQAMLPRMLSKVRKGEIERQNIKVVVRTRPQSKQEKESGVKSIIKYLSHKDILAKDKRFNFDRVFKPETNQIEVYKDVVYSMIPDVLSGYNCTVFAYGQTGSGKTYTMSGTKCEVPVNWEENTDAGIIPRAAIHIFARLVEGGQYECVNVSYLELYNEDIRDLLSDYNMPLNIYSDPKGVVFIQGLTEVKVFNAAGICAQLARGNIKRQTAPTLMNHQSSRSHTVFTITILTKENNAANEEVLKTGKINFVDLAGSENIARSGCKEMRAVESANINKSLLTLGRVIHILAEKSNRHIPYRDSKLTRILQDSLGGHTKTCIIATISPAETSSEETLSTLDYACQARAIKNCPTVNEKLNSEQMIDRLRKAIESLQLDLEASRNADGFYISRASYRSMSVEIESLRAMKSSVDEIIEDRQKIIDELTRKLEEKSKEYTESLEQYEKYTEELQKLQQDIEKRTECLRRERYVARSFEEETNVLRKEMEDLLRITQSLSDQGRLVLGKLEKQYRINKMNEFRAREAVEKVLEMHQEWTEKGNGMVEMDENVYKLCREDIVEFKAALQRPLKELEEAFEETERTLIENTEMKEDIVRVFNSSLFITKIKMTDIKEKCNSFLTKHADIVSELQKDVTGVFESFQGAVREMAQKVSDENSKEEELVHKIMQDLKHRRSEAEMAYITRTKKNKECMEKIDALKQLIQRRREGQRKLPSRVQENADKSRNELKAAMHKFTTKCETIRNDIPQPHELDKFVTDTNKNMVADILKMQQVTGSHELKSLKKTTTCLFEEVTQSATGNIDVLNARFGLLVENRKQEHEALESFTGNVKEVLCDELLANIITVQHTGDTPARPAEVKRRVLETPTAREQLLQMFNTLPEDDEQDKENIPGLLNTSATSLDGFRG